MSGATSGQSAIERILYYGFLCLAEALAKADTFTESEALPTGRQPWRRRATNIRLVTLVSASGGHFLCPAKRGIYLPRSYLAIPKML